MAARAFIQLCLVIIPLAIDNSAAGRFKRIEKRVNVLEVRFDAETSFRREDMSNLINKMESISAMFNSSADYVTCQQQKGIRDESPSDSSSMREVSKQCANWRQDFMQLTKAFTDEKVLNANIRGQFSNIVDKTSHAEEAISRVDKTLDSVRNDINTVATDTKTVLNETNTNQINLIELVHDVTELKQELSRVDKTLINVSNELLNVKVKCTPINERPKSCLELYEKGQRASGEYDVYLEGRPNPIRVFCDQETDGGGWTVFQRREDGSENFYRGWLDYKNGFGDLDGEFWLGNKYLSIMTSTCCHQLRIDLEDFEGEQKHAMYDGFQIRSLDEKYSLKVGRYSGNAGDSLSRHNGMQFSTKDYCAKLYKGAWWYDKCHSSNLNGRYSDGIYWRAWHEYHYSLKFTEMKFR